MKEYVHELGYLDFTRLERDGKIRAELDENEQVRDYSRYVDNKNLILYGQLNREH